MPEEGLYPDIPLNMREYSCLNIHPNIVLLIEFYQRRLFVLVLVCLE